MSNQQFLGEIRWLSGGCPPNTVLFNGKCAPFNPACAGKKIQACGSLPYGSAAQLDCIEKAKQACVGVIATGEGEAFSRPQAYVDYGARSSLQPVQTPKGDPVGPVAPKPAQSKAYRVVVFLNRRIVLLDAMVSGGTPQQVASKVWHGQPLPAMPSVGSPSGTAEGLAQMQKWTVGMKILDKGKVVALYQCGLAGEPCSTPGIILKGYEISGAEGLGQAEQRLIDFLESDSKLSGAPSGEFLGEVHWLGASKSGLTVPQLKETTTYKTCFSDGVVKCHNKYSDPQQVKDCDDGMVEVCLQLADNEVYAQQQGKETSFNVKALQDAINVRLTQLGICNIGSDGKLGPTTCAASSYLISKGLGGPGIAVPNACGTIKGTSTFDPNCKLGQAKNTPPPPCTDANCPPGQECWDNKCVDKCPSGAVRASDGTCKSTATAKSSSGLGLLVLGAAGVGLAFMASRSQLDKIPQHPSRRLQENKHGKRRRRY